MIISYKGISSFYFKYVIKKIIEIGNLKDKSIKILDYGCGNKYLQKVLNRLKIDEDTALKTLLPSEWDNMGTDLGGEAFDTVHNIPKDTEEIKSVEKNPHQLELFNVV